MPDSPTTAMNSDRAWGDMDDMSRRSSLRSTSIGDQGPDSPTGPNPTDNPWGIDQASRRSSHGSTKPEVLVTTIPSVDQKEDDPVPEGKMTMTKLMSLLPVYFTPYFRNSSSSFMIYRRQLPPVLLERCTPWFKLTIRGKLPPPQIWTFPIQSQRIPMKNPKLRTLNSCKRKVDWPL